MDHESFMERALELAELGEGKVNPNPLVGAVLVKSGQIIGEGWHEKFGQAHAEGNAIKNAKADVRGATLYVTLEPCSHYGKTPPCADLIIDSGISKVVVAMEDPNPLVAGRGIARLRQAGVEVVVGVMEKEAAIQNEIFLHYINTNKPLVIIKTAMSLDGKIATVTGESKWISGEASRQYVHKLRGKYMGIMTGISTVLKDDPRLTCRLPKGRDPIRIILDPNLKLPGNARLIHHQSNAPTWIFTSMQAAENNRQRFDAYPNVKVFPISTREDQIDLKMLITALGSMGIDSVLVEAGGTLNFSLIKDELVDKFIVFLAPLIIGGEKAITPVEGAGFSTLIQSKLFQIETVRRFDHDVMIEAVRRRD